jgi:cytochrome c oxidase assembly protein subunit 15
MQAQTLLDLSPVVHLLLVGAMLALLPVAWVWARHRSNAPDAKRHALAVLTLFLTFDLILFGAFTRLSDSGLGCPDWPGCYGHASPMGAHADIAQAQAEMPTGPVTHSKAWIEMVHRYLATSVGGLILLLAVWAWRAKAMNRWWALATLVWVCVQGAFGALTVTMKLFPAIVSLHLLGGYVLLALLVVQVMQTRSESLALPVRWNARWAVIFAALGMVTLQALSGAWVSTNYAVLVCNEFPMCQGSWWPAMDFSQAWQIWRPLGLLADGSVLSFQALTAIHMTHRMLAVVTVVVLGGAWWALRHQASLQMQRRWLAALLGMQWITGTSNVVLDWPMLAAVLHTGGAGAMVAVLVWMLATHVKVRP